MSRGSRSFTGALLAGAVVVTASEARAQREPLCTEVQAHRLLAGPSLAGDDERIVAQPLAGGGDARFVVAVRDGGHTLRAAGAPATPRSLADLGFGGAPSSGARAGGLAVLRLGSDLRAIGEPAFVPDPVPLAPSTAALPTGVALASGVLVLQLLGGDAYATVVPPAGAVPAPHRIAQAPAQPGFAWLTAVPHGDGAVALAGTAAGEVVALRFDHAGALVGEPALWSRRVGGPMELLPTGGPLAALLGRPVRGTGPQNEQARVQVLVPLDESLAPTGEPENTGFAQFPLASALRGRSVLVFQWAQQQGVAIATLPVGAHGVGHQLPRLWYAQPPLEGALLGHAAVLGTGNVVYNVVEYSEAVGSGIHAHVSWVPPSGVPIVRRDVLPVRERMAATPALLPAEDGVVVITAGEDETGGAVDAFHVRCELVSTPGPSTVTDTPATGGATGAPSHGAP